MTDFFINTNYLVIDKTKYEKQSKTDIIAQFDPGTKVGSASSLKIREWITFLPHTKVEFGWCQCVRISLCLSFDKYL